MSESSRYGNRASSISLPYIPQSAANLEISCPLPRNMPNIPQWRHPALHHNPQHSDQSSYRRPSRSTDYPFRRRPRKHFSATTSSTQSLQSCPTTRSQPSSHPPTLPPSATSPGPIVSQPHGKKNADYLLIVPPPQGPTRSTTPSSPPSSPPAAASSTCATA